MEIPRQQRRASERLKKKRRVADAKAGALASRRVAVWRKRHSLKLTAWQKVALIFEMLLAFLGGPLVGLFYKFGWWLEKPSVKK